MLENIKISPTEPNSEKRENQQHHITPGKTFSVANPHQILHGLGHVLPTWVIILCII